MSGRYWLVRGSLGMVHMNSRICVDIERAGATQQYRPVREAVIQGPK